jgi:glycosyltransferase involved in cell wall biosynthesis
MQNISVIVVIFNEENRIENFIKCFSWSNDLIIVDKSSTDKTQSIIKNYISDTIHFETIPYSDAALVMQPMLGIAKNEWIMPITASDLIEPKLVHKLRELISSSDFDFDEIFVPYKMYVLGICDKHSPWDSPYKPLAYRKDKFILSERVHEERSSCGKRYTILDQNCGYFYHITHNTLETFYDRHIRYSDREKQKYDNPAKAKEQTGQLVYDAIKHTFLKRKTYKLGWDGMALTFAYISYFMMTYLSVWQKFNEKGPRVYSRLANSIIEMYSNTVPVSHVEEKETKVKDSTVCKILLKCIKFLVRIINCFLPYGFVRLIQKILIKYGVENG